MNYKILNLILISALLSCTNVSQNGKSLTNINSSSRHSKVDKNLQQAINQLTSPNFFEYTQAARYIIKMGTKAIPILYNARKLVRETNNSVVPVCILIIKIIFKEQKLAWVRQQTYSPHQHIREIALEELKRRELKKN